jgi:hypothetical protein
MTSSRTVLVVPYEKRDEAKTALCQWDSVQKYWYVSKRADGSGGVSIGNYDEFLKSPFIQNYMRVDLTNSKFDDKDEIKKHGGKWDPNEKIWYTYKGNEKLQKFMKYLDTSEATKEKVKKEKKAKKEEHDTIKKDYLANGGTEDEFGRWYSVNILNHE